MPRREDIEKFAQVLNALGDEPAIRAARAEAIEGVPAAGEEGPGTAPTDDLDSLGLEAQAGGGETSEAESLQDIFASLAMPDEGTTPPSGAEAAPGPEEAAPKAGGEAAVPAGPGEGLDFASLFGEEPAPEGIEELQPPPTPRARSGREPAGAAAPPSLEARTDEEAFSFPGGEPESLQSDLAQMETVPEEGAGTEAARAPAGEEFEDLGSLTFPVEPGAEEAPSAQVEETPSVEAPFEEGPSFEEPQAGGASFDIPGGEQAGGESFELPSLDDLAFAEPGAAAPSEAAEPSFEEPSLEQPAETVPLEQAAELPTPPPEEGGLPAGEEAAPSFDLDTAGFEEAAPEGAAGPFTVEPSPGAPAGEPAAAGLEGLTEGEEGLGDLNLEEFGLPESAGQFGIPGEGGGEALGGPGGPAEEPVPPPPKAGRPERAQRRARPQPRAAAQVPAPEAVPELGGAGGEVELTPEQFARLKSTLASLPRNLKIIVQDLIAEGTAAGPDLSALLGLLVRGASAQEIATLAGRISGKRIRIPAGYEKKSGIAFEAEQRTFRYAFRENFWPLIRVAAITVAAGMLFGLLGYNYIFKPVFANVNYRAGYAQIANDRFIAANERFARATSIWPLKQWYYRYAEAFAGRRNYQLAEQKYEDLLKRWPGDKKGILDYAGMESTQLADYQKADGLLKRYLDAHMYDREALLAAGDNYLLWADRDKTKYGPAELAYDTLIDRYGPKDELLFRKLRYYIRTDNGEKVEMLRAFYAARPDVKVDAAAFAELGGYLVDHRRLDFAQDVLLRAEKVQRGLLAVHYNLARYYRITQNADDEKKALDATKQILDLTRPTAALTSQRLAIEIDTHTRLGEYYYRGQEYLPAQSELQAAIRLVETNQKMGLIGKGALYGRPYAVLGDLSYYIEGNLDAAATQYQNAAANSFTSPLLTYKIGYVQYSRKDYKRALATFADAEDASAYPSPADMFAAAEPAIPAATPSAQPAAPGAGGQPPQNLLYALGDTFYQRGDYFAAQASFMRLRERLETRRAALGTLHPEDRPDDRALLNTLIKVNNNLGVTMYRLGERTGDRRKKSEALVYLSAANEIASSLARSPDTVRRSEDRPLPSLNMRGILFPVSGFVLQIYEDLPKDFQAITW